MSSRPLGIRAQRGRHARGYANHGHADGVDSGQCRLGTADVGHVPDKG